MHVFGDTTAELSGWIRDEIDFHGPLAQGKKGAAVKRVQEWLNFHGFGLEVDADYGSVTARSVTRFQEHHGLERTGAVDEVTFGRLVEPMRSVLRRQQTAAQDISAAGLDHARAHLAVHPLEVGGQNRGPWVRLYMKGNEGAAWPWCAGFVTFVLHQAVDSLNTAMPVAGSFSCDSLAAQAKEAGLFLAERDVQAGSVRPGSIFLVRRTPTDWTHTGLVTQADATTFDTIEGNTNDDGHREGFEVCARSRGYGNKDFILLA